MIGRGYFRLVCTITVTSKLSRFRVRVRFRVSNLVLGVGQDFRVMVSVMVIIDRHLSP